MKLRESVPGRIRKFTMAMLVALTATLATPDEVRAELRGKQDGMEWVMPDSLYKEIQNAGFDGREFAGFCNSLFAPIIFDSVLKGSLNSISPQYRGVICFAYGLPRSERAYPFAVPSLGN